jgi:hypothetical protein
MDQLQQQQANNIQNNEDATNFRGKFGSSNEKDKPQ